MATKLMSAARIPPHVAPATPTEKPEELFLVLHLLKPEESVRKRAASLIEQMSENLLFTPETLMEWHESFEGADLETRKLMLCYLLCEQIRPSIPYAIGDRKLQVQLLDFEKQIKNMLAIALGEEAAVEPFIADFVKDAVEAVRFYRQCDRVDELMSAHLESEAEAADTAISERFVEHKESLMHVLDDQKEAVDGLHDTIDTVSVRVNEVRAAVLASAEKMDKLCDKIETEQDHLGRAARSAKELLLKLRSA